MPLPVALLVICPVLLFTLVVGLVVIVALCQAQTKDVPTVWRDSVTVLCRLAGCLPPSKVRSMAGPRKIARRTGMGTGRRTSDDSPPSYRLHESTGLEQCLRPNSSARHRMTPT